MNLFYEDSGSLKVAAVVQKNGAAYQADTPHGKRVKIKAANVLFEFDGDMDDMFASAQNEAAQIDIELLWEAVGEEEFSAEHAAHEYFGAQANKIQCAAVLMALYGAPVYFYKKGKAIFKAAPPEILQQALAAIERKAQQNAQIQVWVDELSSGSLPDAVAAELPAILYAPDKQSLAYKAFTKAAETLKLTPYELAKHTGAIQSLSQYLQRHFEYKHFPNGTQAPALEIPNIGDLPIAAVSAFSIDDESTTEVDDAFSVQYLADVRRVGIHIAIPSLAIAPQSPIENLIFERQSTVYFPSGKITMLPENWISAFSLDEGKTVPVLSVYFDVDAQWNLSAPESRVERVPMDKNLRIQHIEPFFNRETGTSEQDSSSFPHHADMVYLLGLARQLQIKRDRAEDLTQPKKYDYGIDFAPDGKVVITQRERGSPIDTLVSEMMILANSTWAKMLHENNIGGIFRVQPSGRVRMSSHSEPHIGMNLAHYAWFTSPLRRACDFINQKQLLGLLNNDTPRFAAKDSGLFAAIGAFESAYDAYADFQTQMEAYWSLVYLQQESIKEIQAIVLKEDLVRIDGVPLVARATGIPLEIPPKSVVKLAISEIDPERQFIALRYLNVVPQTLQAA